MKRYELIVIWDTGEKETHEYSSKEEAEKIEQGFHRVFGKQVEFTCINERG